MKVKVCGITTVEDALLAASAGADAIGINLFAGPRKIDPDAAITILDALPPMVTPVLLIGVSNGEIPSELADVLMRRRVSHVQVYADQGKEVLPETVSVLCHTGYRPIVTAAVRPDTFPDDVEQWLQRCGNAKPAAILLDAFDATRAGGTGRQADWTIINAARKAGVMANWPPVLLAGGLRPDNVADAISLVRPFGVDVCSGVESTVGRKDPEKLRDFIAGARCPRTN